MSFLYRTTPICRVAATSSSRPAARCFTTSLVQQKGPVEATKDVLKKVDRTVSDAAVSGIEKGQQAKDAAAETVGVGASKASGSASQMAGEAKGKAAELKGEAKGKAEEVKGKI